MDVSTEICRMGYVFNLSLKNKTSFLSIPVAPKITYDKKTEKQTAKAGSKFVLQADITGVPVPSVSWYLNDKPVVDGGDVTIKTSADRSTLQVKGAKVKDAGDYKVKAENEVGSDEAVFNVIIHGR